MRAGLAGLGLLLIVACEVTNQAADTPQRPSMVERIQANTEEKPKELSADAGYFSDQNVKAVEANGIDPYIAAERFPHGKRPPVRSPRTRPGRSG